MKSGELWAIKTQKQFNESDVEYYEDGCYRCEIYYLFKTRTAMRKFYKTAADKARIYKTVKMGRMTGNAGWISI